MATTKTTTKKAPAKRAPKAAAAEPKAVSANEAVVYSMKGEKSGAVALPPALFGVTWNADLVHQVVTGILANARQSIANTKDRGEVRGGGKKPWKQKGTGRARHGSSRSPIWRGGGITFGPRAERDFSVKINRKMRRAAFLAVLSKKQRDGEIIFVDDFSMTAPKTQEAKNALVAIAKGADAPRLATKVKNAAIIASPERIDSVRKSFRNMGNVEMEDIRNLNAADLLTHKYLVLVGGERAIKALSKNA